METNFACIGLENINERLFKIVEAKVCNKVIVRADVVSCES